MSILFVLLTFLLVITITHLLRPKDQPMQAAQPKPWPRPAPPSLARHEGFEIPQGYCFHPGHMWVLDEGRQNARVGIDSFGANLLGKVERAEVIGLNRWVRQGQKVATVGRDGLSVDLVSPIEGVVISVNQELMRDPNLLVEDPYKNGWICVVKAPEISINLNNLMRGPLVGPWLENSQRRLADLTAQSGITAMADGGVPVKGMLAHLDPTTQRAMVKEFFLT